MSRRRPPEPKRVPSKWERERRRRRIAEIAILIAIIAVVSIVGYGYYDSSIRPWHQAIVRVNGTVLDMRYFVNTLRLWGAGQNPYQDYELARQVVTVMQNYELMRQMAESPEVGIVISEESIDAKIKELLTSSDEELSDEEFKQRYKEVLDTFGVSDAAFREIYIGPMLIQTELRAYLGNNEYPQDQPFTQVRIQAILVGTEDQALEIRSTWGTETTETIEQLVNMTSSSHYYPDADGVDWLPPGIESSAFDDYAFSNVTEIGVVSSPTADTQYPTKGGYWLAIVLEEREEGEETELHIQGILLDSSFKAIEVASQFDGENFAELAEEHSLHSASQGAGGDMGWLSLEDAETRIGAAVLDLPRDGTTLSEPILNEDTSKQSGYWLIEVVEKEERVLSDQHRDILVDQVFREWVEQERESEDNRIEDYLDDEKIFWALDHI